MTSLQEAKTYSATGLDAIPMRLLKACSAILAEPITTIINKSISQLTVLLNSPQLKQTGVVPVQKSKIDSSLDNFHPISVLPVLSKILERTVYNQFMDYIILNTIFYHPDNLVLDQAILLRMLYCFHQNPGDIVLTKENFLVVRSSDLSKSF